MIFTVFQPSNTEDFTYLRAYHRLKKQNVKNTSKVEGIIPGIGPSKTKHSVFQRITLRVRIELFTYCVTTLF